MFQLPPTYAGGAVHTPKKFSLFRFPGDPRFSRPLL
nr:MAG TPA: hypothetical protein [Caudoviricetes sp.]